MIENTLALNIANLMMVGWRKGADTTTGWRMRQAVNPYFDNSDEVLQSIASDHVRSIGEVASKVWDQPNEVIAAAMREEAMRPRECSDAPVTITVDNQGKAILKSLLPIEYTLYNRPHRIVLRDGDLTEQQFRDGKWDDENHRWVGQDKSDFAALILIDLVKRFECMMTAFEPQLASVEASVRQEIVDAAVETTVEDWAYLVQYIKYNLGEDE